MELIAEKLVKRYRKRTVVDQVDFSVQRGAIVGLRGPNGAGKTTTFVMIIGVVKPDGGRIILDYRDTPSAHVSEGAPRAGVFTPGTFRFP